MKFKSIIWVQPQARTKSSLTLGSTRFVVDREQELLVVATIVGNFWRLETLGPGALVPTMAALIDVTFR